MLSNWGNISVPTEGGIRETSIGRKITGKIFVKLNYFMTRYQSVKAAEAHVIFV